MKKRGKRRKCCQKGWEFRNAEKVYTIHGFVEEFARDLRQQGISAQPLRESSLDNFC